MRHPFRPRFLLPNRKREVEERTFDQYAEGEALREQRKRKKRRAKSIRDGEFLGDADDDAEILDLVKKMRGTE